MVDYKGLEEFAIEHAHEQIDLTDTYRRRGWGIREVRRVQGKPEDKEISLDAASETLFFDLVKKNRPNWFVLGEHGTYGDKDLEKVVDGDFFDGSRLFQEGFEHMWYSVWTLFRRNKGGVYVPEFTSSLDILNKKLSITREDGNYELNLETGSEKRMMPSGKTDFRRIRLASYVMSPRYLIPFYEKFNRLLETLASDNGRPFIYPNGGSCIYADLANGKIDAYVMINEPRKEIDPSYPMATRVRCPVVSANEDGSFKDYQFDPERRSESIPIFIAACTPELRDTFLDYLKGS